MRNLRLRSAIMLIAGATVATGTPITFAILKSHMDWIPIAFMNVIPYMICGVMWLPSDSARVQKASIAISSLLLFGTLWFYAPMLLNPSQVAGDMVGVGFAFVPIALTIGLLVISALVGIALALKRPRVSGAA
jgi:hypothetical protein